MWLNYPFRTLFGQFDNPAHGCDEFYPYYITFIYVTIFLLEVRVRQILNGNHDVCETQRLTVLGKYVQGQDVALSEVPEKQLRHTKKPSNRPTMQIYRPPGLRSGGCDGNTNACSSPLGGTAKPTQAAGNKQPEIVGYTILKEKEENNNIRQDLDSASINYVSRSSSQTSQLVSERWTEERQRLNRTESSLSSESVVSQKSAGSGSGRGNPTNTGKDTTDRKTKQSSLQKREMKKKVMSDRDVEDAAASLRSLRLSVNATELEQWIMSGFALYELAESIGSALCQHAIEDGSGKVVAKLCGTLKDAPSSSAISKGLTTSVSQYFECRDRLRADHFRMWIAFLNFVTDLYSNMGGEADGELVNCIFQLFDYLLRAPILETLKIEELESLISALLSVGYDLERECPDQLSLLKDLIRDAFIEVSEPWARKMILLLLELGAKLFETTNAIFAFLMMAQYECAIVK
uniref:MIF4G domain-containing protein n=1 Tax=Heterorhabditis bacteriophora TaxID=37862 RepID=A0A1I7WCM2_HETBA